MREALGLKSLQGLLLRRKGLLGGDLDDNDDRDDNDDDDDDADCDDE